MCSKHTRNIDSIELLSGVQSSSRNSRVAQPVPCGPAPEESKLQAATQEEVTRVVWATRGSSAGSLASSSQEGELLHLITAMETREGDVIHKQNRTIGAGVPVVSTKSSLFPSQLNNSVRVPVVSTESSLFPNQLNNPVRVPVASTESSLFPNQLNNPVRVPVASTESSLFPNQLNNPVRVPVASTESSLLPNQLNNPVRVPVASTESSLIPNQANNPAGILYSFQFSHPERVAVISTGNLSGNQLPSQLSNPVQRNTQQMVPVSTTANVTNVSYTQVLQHSDATRVVQGSGHHCDLTDQGDAMPPPMSTSTATARLQGRQDAPSLDPCSATFQSGSCFTIKTLDEQLCGDARLQMTQGRCPGIYNSSYCKPNQTVQGEPQRFQLGEHDVTSSSGSQIEPQQTPHRIIRVCTTSNHPTLSSGVEKNDSFSSVNKCTELQRKHNQFSFPETMVVNASDVLLRTREKDHVISSTVRLVDSPSFDPNQVQRGENVSKHLFVCFICSESLLDQASLEEHLSGHGMTVVSSSDKEFVLANKPTVKSKESNSDRPLDETTCDPFEGSVEYPHAMEKESIDAAGQGKQNVCGGIPVVNGNVPKEVFSCLVCKISCSNRRLLDQHMRSHTGERPFVCTVCSKAFSQKSTLTVHQRQHSGEQPFQCELCPRKFKQRGNYNVHLRGHTGECPFQCSECGKTFKRSRNLKQHFRTHTGDSPFECEICQTKLSSKTALQKHARMHGSPGELPQVSSSSFQCLACNATFTTKGSLTTHSRTHTKTFSFPCTQCDKKFSTQPALSAHCKTHSVSRPFPCQLCNMRFKQKIHLTVHIRTHTGEKPYKCSVCEYRCAQKSLLTTHMKSHSGGHPQVPGGCQTKSSSVGCPSCPFVCTKNDSLAQHVAECHPEDSGQDKVLSYEGRALIKEADLLASEAKSLLEKAEASEKRATKLMTQAKKIQLKAMTIEETARTDALEKLARTKEREPCEEVYEEEEEEEEVEGRFLPKELPSNASTTKVKLNK